MRSATVKPFWSCLLAVLLLCTMVLVSAPEQARAQGSFGYGVMGWGSNADGVMNVPAPNISFSAVAAGDGHGLGLKQDGTITAWGNNGAGQCNVPAPNSGFIAIAGGSGHSIALRASGSIAVWGSNSDGQLNIPTPNSGFTAIAAGSEHCLGLKSDGSIVAWGWNSDGQCNVPLPNSGFIGISAGAFHSIGIKSDGSLVVWGSNTFGQLDVPAPNTGFSAVSAGGIHSLGLKSDGSIVAWGSNGNGQLNVPAPNSGFVSVAAGWGHSLALRTDRSVAAWGWNLYGQCDVAAPNTGYASVSAAWSLSLALKTPYDVNASVFYTGHGSVSPASQGVVHGDNVSIDLVPETGYHPSYILDNGKPVPVADPYVINDLEGPHDVIVFFAPDTCTIKVRTSGLGYVTGARAYDYGNTATLYATPSAGWHFVNWTEGGVVVGAMTSWSFTVTGNRDLIANFAMDTDPVGAEFWGVDWYGQPNVPQPNTGFISVGASGRHCVGLKSDGTLVAWGDNWAGQLNIPSPNSGFTAISVSGYAHTLALRQDGSVAAWGFNDHGECNVPTPNTGFVAVAAGRFHSLGLKADGSIVGWGDNSDGQLNIPSPNSGYVSITAGDGISLGLKEDGTVVGWGYNTFGQCNPPAPNSDFVAISAGWWHVLGLKADGSVVGWGWNSGGECNAPAPNSNFTAVAGGYMCSFGLKADGTIVGWGHDYNGQLNIPAPNSGFRFLSAQMGLRKSHPVTAAVSPDGHGSVSPSSWYVIEGQSGTVDITPDPGYHISFVTDNGGSVPVSDPYVVSDVHGARNILVFFELNQYAITTTVDGSGSATGAGTYGHGSSVTLVATPDANWHFVNWTEGGTEVSTSATYTFPADSDLELTAHFAINSFAVTASADGSGSVGGDGFYNYGDPVTVTATPGTNWHFVNWTEGGVEVSTSAAYTFSAESSRDLVAHFAIDKHGIAATVSPPGSGSVEGAGDYGYGSTASLTATAAAGWHFVNWTEGGVEVSIDAVYSFTVEGSRELAANFAIDTFTISTSVSGSGSDGGAGTYDYGDTVTLTATPAAHWHFVNWTEGGVEVSTSEAYVFSADSDRVLIANFAIDTFAVTLTATPPEGGSVGGSSTYDYGTSVTVTATPAAHWHFVNWTEGGVEVSTSETYVFSADSDRTLCANFAIDRYMVTASAGFTGHGSVDPVSQSIGYGSPASIDLVPDTGYHAVHILDNDVAAPVNDPYVISEVMETHNMMVFFDINTYTVGATAEGSGTVNGGGTYEHFSIADLTAVPEEGWHFVIWTEGGVEVSTDAAYSFIVEGPRDLVAHFEADPVYNWYLAEGCTDGGTETWVLVENINPVPVELNITFTTAEGLVTPPELQGYKLAANTRASFNAGSYAISYDLSTVVSANGGNVVVERAMYGADRSWATDSIGTQTPSDTWYLAEGCTGEGFETWVLVQNPGTSPVTVDLTLMTGSGTQNPPVLQDVYIAANSRISFNLGQFVTDYDVSTLVQASGGEVVCERAMYGNGRAWAHDSIGVTAPAETWYLAEGSTGEGFETWVLVQNPGTSAVSVGLTLMTGSGSQAPAGLQDVIIQAGTRRSFNLGEYLAEYDVSTVVKATGGKVVCERAMYGNERNWGTDSIGSLALAGTWYLAEGSTGEGFETWVLVANPGTSAVNVDLTFMTSSGAVVGPRDVTVAPGSRHSFNLGEYVTDYNVSTMIEASGGVVCERAMYGAGRTWAHDSIGWAP